MRVRKIGIAVAVYEPNLAYLSSQLLTIQKQTFRDWICLVLFDSPMKAVLDADSMKPLVADARFQWIENPARLGHRANFEKAIGLLAAHPESLDAIACSDQDDLWYPDKLEVCARELERAGPLSLVHCDMHVGHGAETGGATAWELEKRGTHNADFSHLLVRNVVAGASMLFDARLARLFPRIPDGIPYHDHWYALVAASHGGVHPIYQPLYCYRQHETNLVGITPFRGTFKLNPGLRFTQVPRKCHRIWTDSQKLARVCREQGLMMPAWLRLLFLRRVDFGASLVALGTYHWSNDRALARACFARALGKLLSLGAAVRHWRPTPPRWHRVALLLAAFAMPAEAHAFLHIF